MRQYVFNGLFSFTLGMCSLSQALAAPTFSADGICFRFYDQWKVPDKDKARLQKKYGTLCIHFDKRGTVLADSVSPALKGRFLRFYNQCMKDGCLFCDANEGSCDLGTCGQKNADCKPYMRDGLPVCGEECAYYALSQL